MTVRGIPGVGAAASGGVFEGEGDGLSLRPSSPLTEEKELKHFVIIECWLCLSIDVAILQWTPVLTDSQRGAAAG